MASSRSEHAYQIQVGHGSCWMTTKPQTQTERQAKWRLLFFAFVLLLGAAAAYVGMKKLQPRTGIEHGDAAPAFRLSRYGGGTVSLGDLRGKVVLLDFWATWCVPCAAEMPALTRFAREYESKGLILIAANQDDRETANTQIAAFLAAIAPDLGRSVVFADEQTTRSYAVDELPMLYFIGRDGRILESYAGYVPESLLRQKIELALRK